MEQKYETLKYCKEILEDKNRIFYIDMEKYEIIKKNVIPLINEALEKIKKD